MIDALMISMCALVALGISLAMAAHAAPPAPPLAPSPRLRRLGLTGAAVAEFRRRQEVR